MNWTVSDVTAVVTCFESGDLLQRALDSICSQGPINIVLIDDGSRDCSCLDLAPNYERLMHLTKENGGHPSALNFGISRVETGLIAFLDDDDEWLPGKSDRQVNLLNVSNAEVVIGAVNNVWEHNGDVQREIRFPSTRMLGSSMFTTRSLRRVGDFAQEARHHSIIDWWSKAEAAGLDLIHDDEPALMRRIDGRNSGIVHRDAARHDLLHHLHNHLTRQRSS